MKLLWNFILNYHSPFSINPIASLIDSIGIVWLTNSSTISSLERYSSTSFGTWSRLFHPEFKKKIACTVYSNSILSAHRQLTYLRNKSLWYFFHRWVVEDCTELQHSNLLLFQLQSRHLILLCRHSMLLSTKQSSYILKIVFKKLCLLPCN